jgi:hypothetical protein
MHESLFEAIKRLVKKTNKIRRRGMLTGRLITIESFP